MKFPQILVCSFLFIVTLHTSQSSEASGDRRSSQNSIPECDDLPNFAKVRSQIQSHKSSVDKIIEYTFNASRSKQVWNELALFCDRFGPRMSGSKSLELAINYLEKKMRHESKLNVTSEPVMIPKWEVYEQWAQLETKYRTYNMSILALGSSVATNGVLEKEVIIIHTFDDLDYFGDQIRDKIVVFNYKFISYPKSVEYRTKGAALAAKYGAAAALVRSVTPFSIYSPHTGMGSRTIPTAAITLEDADLIQRWIDRGESIKLRLKIETKHFDDVQSYNLVGDITGSSRPQEVVFVSGHMDSWYNTDGAMDDGGGMMISYMALDLLNKLHLRGQRTMRAILWTSEEFGLIGAQQYFIRHKKELDNFKVVIESDEGTFTPRGFGYANMGPLGQCVIWEILNLTQPLGTGELVEKFEGSDIELFTNAKVPGLSLFNQNGQYFYFHHTSGDSMSVEDPESLNRATALFASTLFVLSNLDVDMRE